MDLKRLRIRNSIERDDCDFLRRQFQNGLDPNFFLDLGRKLTILHFAVGFETRNQYDIVKLILENKGNPNARASDGSTPLHICALWNHADILKLLLSYDGNPLVKDNNDQTAFNVAAEENNHRSLKILLNHYQTDSNDHDEISDSTTLTENLNDLTELISSLNIGFDNVANDGVDDVNLTEDETEILFQTAIDSSSFTLNKGINCDNHLMTNTQIRDKLKEMGENPGPITNELRDLYLRRLMVLLKKNGMKDDGEKGEVHVQGDERDVSTFLPNYPKELEMILKDRMNADQMRSLDHELSLDFATPDPKRKWRDGTRKTCFNYLLLDPRKTKKLQMYPLSMNLTERFVDYINSIFYVGKGQSNRPLQHLTDAKRAIQRRNPKLCDKEKRILEIWRENLGVVCLRIFQNAIPAESFTREACIISALGKSNVTNEKGGEIYGSAKTWTASKQRLYGAHLLKRSLQVYLNDGERQIRPQDLNDR